MEIRRTEVLRQIRRRLLDPDYTLGDALLDIDELYRAGSLHSALQASFLNQQRTNDPNEDDEENDDNGDTGEANTIDDDDNEPDDNRSNTQVYPSTTSPI